ncbi:MAG: hypothetical protein HUU54_05560 [Ignavibacteriaceae bacterium]|nr:hypothetical protein [Ignavibacteriaceae bacterium]
MFLNTYIAILHLPGLPKEFICLFLVVWRYRVPAGNSASKVTLLPEQGGDGCHNHAQFQNLHSSGYHTFGK